MPLSQDPRLSKLTQKLKEAQRISLHVPEESALTLSERASLLFSVCLINIPTTNFSK